MPFLTDIDSRAKIRGSRDPLGFVPLWSRFGRTVVGNLTTVSNSVRGFTTLLLGYHFAREAQERGCKDSTLELFLRFEQLAAYARRSELKHEGFRGVERVTKALDGGGGKVVLSAEQDHQILSNQRTYGLWGLFSSPARESALLEQNDSRLTSVAEEFVRAEYISKVTHQGDKGGRKLVELLSEKRGTFELNGRHAKLAKIVANLHEAEFSRQERAFYDKHLLRGAALARTDGRQEQVAALLEELPSEREFDMSALLAITKSARSRGADWQDLTGKLEAIREIELLLVPAESAYGFLLSRNGHDIAALTKEVASAWGARVSSINPGEIATLRPFIALAIGDAGAGRLVNVAESFAAGRYDDALLLLVEHNAAVMQARGGAAPWIRIDKQRLDVRFRDESGDLGSPDWLANPWSNSYFVDSLFTVHRALVN